MQNTILPEPDDYFDLQEEYEHALEGLRIAQELQSPFLIALQTRAVKRARTALNMEFGSPDDDTESDLGE